MTVEYKEETVKGNGFAFVLVALVTVVWILAAIYYTLLGPFPERCQPAILCLEPGNFGSYLQGVFAPVGFFWVALAVYIQSQELKEQRRELARTREEFEQNRAVMELQVEEARKQAQLLDMQTQLLVKASAEAETLAKFQAHVSLLATRLRQYPNGWTFDGGGVTVNNDGTVVSPFPQIAVREKDIKDDGDQTLIASTTNVLRTKTRFYRKDRPDIVLSAKSPRDFLRIFRAMDRCRQEAKALPEARAVLAEALELEELGDIMDWLKDHTGNLSR